MTIQDLLVAEARRAATARVAARCCGRPATARPPARTFALRRPRLWVRPARACC